MTVSDPSPPPPLSFPILSSPSGCAIVATSGRALVGESDLDPELNLIVWAHRYFLDVPLNCKLRSLTMEG